MKFFTLFSICSSLLLLSCRSSKTIQSAITKKDTVVDVKIPTIDSNAIKADLASRVHSNTITCAHFAGKMKLDYTDQNGKGNNATAQIRMRIDSLIWVSITGPLGIEGFRALIRPDSVFVMDKLEHTISRRSVSYLQEIVKLPLDFSTLQDLILGNPVYFNDNITSFRANGPNYFLLSVGKFFKHLATLDTTNNRVLNSKLDDVDETRSRTCNIANNEFQQIGKRTFSTERNYTFAEKNKLDVSIKFTQVVFDEPQSFIFNIPKGYRNK